MDENALQVIITWKFERKIINKNKLSRKLFSIQFLLPLLLLLLECFAKPESNFYVSILHIQIDVINTIKLSKKSFIESNLVFCFVLKLKFHKLWKERNQWKDQLEFLSQFPISSNPNKTKLTECK